MGMHDHRKILKSFYEMKANTIDFIQVPSLQFVMMEGRCRLNWAGLPEEDGAPIFKLVNQLKRMTKTALGYQFTLMPHEYIWHKQHEDGTWSYTRLMQVPELITLDMYEEARHLMEKGYKGQPVPQTKLVVAEQGLCAQKLHQGHFNNIQATYGHLREFVQNNGDYKQSGDCRTILVHWCAPEPEKWAKIVRVPVAAMG